MNKKLWCRIILCYDVTGLSIQYLLITFCRLGILMIRPGPCPQGAYLGQTREGKVSHIKNKKQVTGCKEKT